MKENIEFKNFTNLNQDEIGMILQWRNCDDVRKWMYNSGIISLQEHKKFIESLKNNIEKKYFLICQNNSYIGVIYLTDITNENNSAELGLYTNPQVRGVGKTLMQCIIEYGFNELSLKRLTAEVFLANSRAIDLYSKIGFLEYDKKNVAEQKVICMELKNENR